MFLRSSIRSGVHAVFIALCLLLLAPIQTMAQPVISHLKTGDTGLASNEFIAIYNNGDNPVDVSGWCVSYSSSSDATKTTLACLTAPTQTKIMISPQSYARFSSQEFKGSVPGFTPDGLFTAGMSGTSGHIRLFDAQKTEIDKLAWGAGVSPEGTAAAAHTASMSLQRRTSVGLGLQDSGNNSLDFTEVLLSTIPASGLYEEALPVDVCTNIDGLQTSVPIDYFANTNMTCSQDVCDNIDGLQEGIPAGFDSPDGLNCAELESARMVISELLPNVSGSDTGKEYIELYNPNDRAINLNGYMLQLGPEFTKTYTFGDYVVAPYSYASFSDTQTGLVLPNTTSTVRILAPNGSPVDETATYSEPGDDKAWAMVDLVWQFTNQPTPAAPNKANSLAVDLIESGGLVPCEPGKYRNPETNRCRNIEVGDTELKPCEVGQIRNNETNRCRSNTSADSLVPCKTGQERNPETNRCRSVISTASSLVPCDLGEERNPETNRCRKSSVLGDAVAKVHDVPSEQIGAGINYWYILPLIAAAIGYGIYEWRYEMLGFLRTLRTKLPL